MKPKVYVLTMRDCLEDYNHGIYTEVYANYDKAISAWNKMMNDEIADGTFTRDDLRVTSVGFSETTDGRFAWTIDELEVM